MKNFIFLVIFAVIFGGCAGAKISQQNLAQSQTKFLNATAKCIDGEINKKLEAKINEQLKKQNIAFGDELIISCEILTYDEGNRALRYFIGFGAGAAKSSALVKLSDKNGKNLGDFSVDASMAMGIFGGDAESVLDGTAYEVVRNIKEKQFL